MKKFLFLFIVFFSFSVFAEEVDVTGNCYGSTGYARMYSGDEVEYQTYSNYNFGTTYQKQLSSFETELRYSFSANTQYTLTFNTNGGNDFRNNFQTWSVYDLDNNDNDLVNSFTFISMKKIQITFTTTSATTKVKVQFGGSNVYDNITGETNWNIKNAILTIPNSGSGGSTNQDIINNNNDNTNNIIDNANQNTQDIINNQNSIANGCVQGPKDYSTDLYNFKKGYYLSSTNTLVSDSYRAVSPYFMIKENTSYSFDFKSSNPTNGSVCWYWSNYGLARCDTISSRRMTLTAPSGAYYMRLTAFKSGNEFMSVQVDGSICNDWNLENSNNNTNTIVDNANQNTQDIINSNKSCTTYDKNNVYITGKYLGSNGSILSNSAFGISDYIKIDNNSIIKVLSTTGQSPQLCFYDNSKVRISCIVENTLTLNQILTIPSNANYVRFTFYISGSNNVPTFSICKNGNQAISDSITNDNVDNGVGSDFFDGFTSQDFGLSDIITIPLTTIQTLTSQTCSVLNVPIPFTNSSLSLPCMSEIYSSKFPSIYNLWQIVSFGIISYFIAIDIFRIVKGFKDPESDKVEVLDL